MKGNQPRRRPQSQRAKHGHPSNPFLWLKNKALHSKGVLSNSLNRLHKGSTWMGMDTVYSFMGLPSLYPNSNGHRKQPVVMKMVVKNLPAILWALLTWISQSLQGQKPPWLIAGCTCQPPFIILKRVCENAFCLNRSKMRCRMSCYARKFVLHKSAILSPGLWLQMVHCFLSGTHAYHARVMMDIVCVCVHSVERGLSTSQSSAIVMAPSLTYVPQFSQLHSTNFASDSDYVNNSA